MRPNWLCSPAEKWLKKRNNYPIDQLPDELKPLVLSPQLTLKTNIRDIDILVVDFETTGVDPQNEQILSMGWVVIEKEIIRLSSARYMLINEVIHSSSIANTAKIHQLLPQELSNKGIALSCAFSRLFQAMENKLILVHGTVIEERFFNQYINKTYQLKALPIPWLDTLRMEQARNQMVRRSAHPEDWRLSTSRQHYGLPLYAAHNALVDAMASAELFLAQIMVMFGHEQIDFETIFKISR
ncbi:exonuclease domain-containing protein [Celerinatantimonas yamalensis]|uniref:Exonuclease domain-containing protein n=1 Tax=Celerinatantimonas yamalensis TaxID=559956 RepID=A0ABW9G5J0_9GAMM